MGRIAVVRVARIESLVGLFGCVVLFARSVMADALSAVEAVSAAKTDLPSEINAEMRDTSSRAVSTVGAEDTSSEADSASVCGDLSDHFTQEFADVS
jgi:hypothetical protein